MITPPITISADNVVLSWRARTSHKTMRDGYAVYVSETGGKATADFNTAAPLFSVNAEEYSWTEHSVSLAAYRGKTVTLAFVNNSGNKDRLYIDDIFVGVRSNAYLRLDNGTATPYSGDIAISGVAYTKNETPVSGYTIGLEYGGKTFTQNFSSELTTGAEIPFTLDAKLPICWHETVPYTVWIDADGTRYAVESQVTSYPKKVVCDDVTGTWCGWCVRGIVSLDNLRKNFSDRSIGLAAHSADVMYDSITDYTYHLSEYISWLGLPAGGVDRRISIDPGNFIAYIDDAINWEKVRVAMQVAAEKNADTGEFTADTKLWFAESGTTASYRLAYVITENRVHQPGDNKYKQRNYYSGGSTVMGGYENLPEYVPSEQMWFDDVVRCTVGDFIGIEGSVPTEIRAEEAVEHQIKFTLPTIVFNSDECELVALLIDQADGHVVNAEKVALGNGSLGVNTVSVNAANATETARYNAAGLRLTKPERGLNIIKMSDGRTLKVIVK